MTASRGSPNASHRVLPHTADVIIEAEADDAAWCLAEAVQAFAEIFADPPASREHAVRLGVEVAAADPLGELLEEAVYRLDASGLVVFDADLSASDSGFRGDLIAVCADLVEVHGSVPKGVASATLTHRRGSWRARAIVDV